MSTVEELYGQKLNDSNLNLKDIRFAKCPFTDSICDGGGNRNMARVAADDIRIGKYFDSSIGKSTGGFLPCGVCSVTLPQRNESWAICPRRLLSFNRLGISTHQTNLAKRIYQIAGFLPSQRISIWSEIALRETSESGKIFNYRFDYVLSTPDLSSPPVIIEVMTCSTSGGNRKMGTDIQEAFRRSVTLANSRGENVATTIEAPGINVRQVWARMASQIIAKSEVANSWGGRTIWVVQDNLVEYIRRNTALPLDELLSVDWKPNEVNMIVSDLTEPVALYSGPIRPADRSIPSWIDLLGAPYKPKVSSIKHRLRRSKPLVTVIVS